MAEHWVDTTNPGGDSGHAIGDAWQDATSWMTHAKIASDICYIRGNGQSHAQAANKNWAGDGVFGNPAITRGDDGTIWGGDDGTYPIFDFAGNNVEWLMTNENYMRFERLRFRDGEGDTFKQGNADNIELHDCQWEDNSGETPVFMIEGGVGGYNLVVKDCTMAAKAGTGIIVPSGADIRDTTIDNCTTRALRNSTGVTFLENVVFGGTIANATDIQCDTGQVIGRNVTFNAVTEVNISAVTNDVQDTFVAIEDYNGVKGAWKKWYYHGTMESFSGPLTPGGQRAGGSYWVIKAVANGNGSAYAPLLCRYWPVYVALGGSGSTLTQDVTVWIQPDNGDASVPDTQGADADVWVEIAAWNNVSGEYDYYDSRDKAAQNAQVDHAWGDIVVENVDIGATGWIIIRIYCISTETFYIDRVETIA